MPMMTGSPEPIAIHFVLINGNSCQNAWNTLMQKLYQDILAGKYKNNHPYEIPLTKVQVYKMKKMNIPPVFYEGYEGD